MKPLEDICIANNGTVIVSEPAAGWVLVILKMDQKSVCSRDIESSVKSMSIHVQVESTFRSWLFFSSYEIFFFQTVSHVALTVFKVTKFTMSFWCSCLYLLSAVVAGSCHHAWFYLMVGTKSRVFCMSRQLFSPALVMTMKVMFSLIVSSHLWLPTLSLLFLPSSQCFAQSSSAIPGLIVISV